MPKRQLLQAISDLLLGSKSSVEEVERIRSRLDGHLSNSNIQSHQKIPAPEELNDSLNGAIAAITMPSLKTLESLNLTSLN